MLQTKYLLNHIDALLRLSHEVRDRAASAKLREMADEFRIMVSVADVSDLAATLSKSAAPPPDLIGPDAGSKKVLAVASDEPPAQPSRVFQARYSGSNGTFACSRVGAP
jgi:hypothetical protein